MDVYTGTTYDCSALIPQILVSGPTECLQYPASASCHLALLFLLFQVLNSACRPAFPQSSSVSGIKQSSGQPVLQAGGRYTHDTGFYGGLWGSMVNRRDDDTEYEFDGYAGWYVPVFSGLALDLGYTRYTFQGDKNTTDDAYGEGFLNVLLSDSVTLGYRHSPDYLGNGEELQTLELGYVYNGEEFGFEASVRQLRYLSINDDVNWGGPNTDDYFHFRLGMARTYGDNEFSLAVEKTNLNKEFDGNTQIIFNFTRHFGF